LNEWIQLLGGGLLLYFGAEWFVAGASALALALRVPQLLVGLTVVAYGTSAPEIIVGVQAAGAGHGEVALGNVIGSNIFNTFLCLGAAGLAGSVGAPLHTLGVDLVALVVMTGLAAAFIRTERTISRLEGGVAVALYAVFTALTVARG
jgi:cation:H+ antiporter